MGRNSSEKSVKARRKIMLDSIMVFFIVISPFIFNLHEYLPREKDNFTFLGINIGSNQFADVATYVWFLLGKIIPLYLFFIWFFTCKHWWYHAILIPIAMYAFQIFEVVNFDARYVDKENILWLLPVCMVVIPFVYFIRIKLYDKHVHGIDLEAMDAELQELKKKTELSDDEPKNNIDRQNEELEKQSISEEIDQKLSTGNLEDMLKQFQHKLQDWLHI